MVINHWAAALGPALEAQEALTTLTGGGSSDLREKAVSLAGLLFEMVGQENGRQKAIEIIDSGKAEKKMREIIEAQGGNPNVKIKDIPANSEKKLFIQNKQVKSYGLALKI